MKESYLPAIARVSLANLLLLIAAPSQPLLADSLAPAGPSGPTWIAQREAVALLMGARTAHGLAGRAAPRSIRVVQSGFRTLYNQSPDWDRPPVRGVQNVTLLYDIEDKRISEQRESRAPGGFRLLTNRAFSPAGGYEIDPQRRGTGDFWQKLAPSDWATAELAATRAVPTMILERALSRAPSLRYRGRRDDNGRSVDLLDYAEPDGTLVTLRLDARTHLLDGYEQLGDELVSGDRVASVRFADYADVAGIQLPRRRIETSNGSVTLEQALRWDIDAAIPADLLVVPSGYRDAAANSAEESILRVGEGVWLLQNLPGGDRVLAIEFADSFGIVEAPGPLAAPLEVFKRLEIIAPGKRLKWVGFSHHHSDHGGALRPYIARGVQIVSTAREAGAVLHIAAAPHSLVPDELERQPRPLNLKTFARRLRIEDSGNTVDLIDIGPTSHARSMVVAWLPRQKVLFQGDMLNLPDAGSPAAGITLTAEGLRAIKRLGIKPDKVVGVHGEVGTLADWQAEVDSGAATGPKRSNLRCRQREAAIGDGGYASVAQRKR